MSCKDLLDLRVSILWSFLDFTMWIKDLTNKIGGVDGTRTRDPRRDRPVF